MRRRFFAAWSVLLLACAEPRGAAPAATLGQWIWTAKDAQLFREARTLRPALQGGVWIGTITLRGDSLAVQLGHAPLSDARESPVVVRFDDSLHALFATASDREIADRLTTRLAPLVSFVDAPHAAPRAVQIDYDVPVRLLPRYAAVLRLLRRGVLRGRSVWVTSLVAHLRAPHYGSLLRGVVDGHVVQLFDTGDTFSPASVATLARSLQRADLPFMVGVGTFERTLAGGRRTTHRAWLEQLPALSALRGYRGLWVFPAGQRYLSLLPAS